MARQLKKEVLIDHLERQGRLDREWLKEWLADIETNGISDVPEPANLATS